MQSCPSCGNFTAGVIALLLGTSLYLVESCPSSCAVCSPEAAVCQGLAYITAFPTNTEILMITDGNITSIGVNNFSYLSNLTLLRLSGNKIQEIQDGAFLNLTQLRSLELDSNHLSAASVSSETFLSLSNLKTLQLNNNYFANIDGTWFQSTKHLIKLGINRNRITNLTHHSIGPNAFRSLEHLDVSSNYISFIHEEAFLGLKHLRELDLSKNRLTKLPGVFSSLSHLSLLNLSQNHWNCTCELHKLADYLRNYTLSAARILRNANGLRCSYSNNPVVKSLLQLTERNCASRSYNITAASREEDRGYFREAIFISILVLAGVIAALFLIIIIIVVKCNLRPHDSIERDLTSCSCGEAQDFPGIRSHVPKLHVTQANNGDVMSFVDPARIRNPFMKKSTGSGHRGYNPEGSGKSFPASSKENVPGRYYVCYHCRLVQWYRPCPPVMSDAGGIPDHTKCFVRAAPSTGANTAVLQDLSRFKQGAASIRQAFPPPSVLAAMKSDNAHKPDPGYSIAERGSAKAESYKHRADVMSHLTTNDSVEMKIHAARPPPLRTQRWQRGGPGVLLDKRRDISFPTDNNLICKYVECDKLGGTRRLITEPQTQNVKFEQQKIQTHVTQENSFLNNESVGPSARVRQAYIPRSVGFYIPHTQHEPDVALYTSQSRQEQEFFRPHLGSKYLLTTDKNAHEGRQRSREQTILDPLTDFDFDPQISSIKYTRNSQDYLRVKVNLKPFRKVRVHPQKNTGLCAEPTKRGHGSKQLPAKLPRKKLKGRSTSSGAMTKTTNQSTTAHHEPNRGDDSTRAAAGMAVRTVTKNKNTLDEKSKGRTGGQAATSDDHANDPIANATYTTLNERVGTASISAEQPSKVLSREELLNSEVDEKLNVAIGQNRQRAEPGELAFQGRREELTESELQAQCGSRDNTDALRRNVLGTKLSNVTGISGGAESLSCGSYSECDIDIAGSSLPGNKVNGHLESSKKDDITAVGHSLGPDNSTENIIINDPADRGTGADGSGSLADPVQRKSEFPEGCEIENNNFEGYERKDINDPAHVKMYPAANLPSIPGREEPPSSAAFDIPVSTNERLQADDGLLMQGSQENKQDAINTSQQQVSESGFQRAGPASRQLDDPHSTVANEALSTGGQTNEASDPTTELAATAEQAQTSAACPQRDEQNNSNNNHSKPPAEAVRKHLSLSDSSKVIIVVESLNKTVNIQRYLTERGTRLQAQLNTNPSSNKTDGAAGDGSPRKKISLILPEKSSSGAPKSTSKKIK